MSKATVSTSRGPGSAGFLRLALLLSLILAVCTLSLGQNSSTGAVSGLVTDPTGAVVAGAEVKVTNTATGEVRTVTSHADGVYQVPLLPPGKYRVDIAQTGFKTTTVNSVTVVVTETASVNVKLELGSKTETVEVIGAGVQVQTESAEMGQVTSREMIASLPLVSRNYTQIIALNPGIAAEPTSASELGRGSGSDGGGGGGFSAHGGMTNDNNFQMNGVEINDTQGSLYMSGGIAVPNPDSLQEFKVLTSQYDASYGRNSGANVNVVTKSGTNEIHGSAFEFFRNNVLNANEYFRKSFDQPRAVLKQNQFGGALGAPLIKNKLFAFGSYQGTRQRNGLDSNCTATIYTPPLTNDRSAEALGALFAGRQGYINAYIQQRLGISVGPSVLADGSNINPVALAILQAQNPDGSYLIPTPQQIVAPTETAPLSSLMEFDTLGRSSISTPCPYTENQVVGSIDYLQSDKSKWSGKFFISNSTSSKLLYGGVSVPGFPVDTIGNFRNVSIDNTYVVGPSLFNQFTLGFTRQFAGTKQNNPYTFADFGMNAPEADNPPRIIFSNLAIGGFGQGMLEGQNTYVVQDQMVWARGKHTLKFGGGLTRIQINESGLQYSGVVGFMTFADLLLGLNAEDNGTAGLGMPYSNVIESIDLLGDTARYFRVWDGNVYLQDDIKLTPHFTLNLGLRYERLGAFSDPTGRFTGFDLALADPTPPEGGTYAGYTVPANFKGDVPAGVTRASNNYGIAGDGQNTWNPRIGFAWQLPGTSRFVLRGGYGMFHSRTTGVGAIQGLSAPPLTYQRAFSETENAAATAANPFPAFLPALPYFPPIATDTLIGPQVLGQHYQPPVFQRFSLGLQSELAKNLVLDLSYVGSRGTKLIWKIMPNQAMLASPENPIRGVTENTVDNITDRVPYQGLSTTKTLLFANGGSSWYNALDASLVGKTHGVQFQASYTFARNLTDDPGVTSGTIGGNISGNQMDPHSHYGPDPFTREHRFVFSYVYEIPGPKDLKSLAGRFLGGWSLTGVTVAQSGRRLTVSFNNEANVYGITADRADFIGGCSVARSGSTESRLDEYFNTGCFDSPAVIGDDGYGTTFGTGPIGIVTGPRQVNFDMSLVKKVLVGWPNEGAHVEFRSEFFNAFNHPQFDTPDTSLDSGTFGRILSTIGNPRIIQFALKYNF